MQIDWLTVGAQIVNFLILVWLLQRFLYGPITRAMERREQRIAQRLHDAEQRQEAAEDEARAYREQQADLERRRNLLITAAREEAEAERKTLRRASREEFEQRRREWRKQLEEQQGTFMSDIRRRSTEHFFALARRALGDLANARLEEQAAHVFIRQLEGLDKGSKEKIAAACHKAGNSVTVRSGFEVPPSEKREITRSIHEQISDGANVTYEQSAEIACGIVLKAGSQTVSWDLDSYFDRLERQAGEDVARLMPSSG